MEEEVAEWGERWLTEWVSSAHSNDRESRQWVADGWRRGVTLDTVMQWWQQDGRDSFIRHQVEHEVSNLVGLYRWTGNGLVVWRMFHEYRAEGLPVPEMILAKFDQWGARLEKVHGAAEVAAAIEMTTRGGGATGGVALRKAERRRRIASAVHHCLTWGSRPLKPEQAYARVARENQMTSGAVKRLWTEWQREVRDAESESARRATDAALRNLGR